MAILIPFIMAAGLSGKEKPAESTNDQSQSAKIDKQETAAPEKTQIIAYYFHGDQRCATCIKLESYSREALEDGFEEKMGDSTIVFTMVNYDQKENKHYIDDYKLYTKALILSKVSGGKEIEWVNLDKIWQLVRDKDKYLEYVRTETENFMNKTSK